MLKNSVLENTKKKVCAYKFLHLADLKTVFEVNILHTQAPA